MSKIRLSAVEVRWCKLQAMRDSAYLNASQGDNFIEAYDAMVKCRTYDGLIRFESKWIADWDGGLRSVYLPYAQEAVIERCNTYQAAMRFAIETRQAKADA